MNARKPAGGILLAWMGICTAQAADFIVDNTDAGFSITGTWSTGTDASDYGPDYRYKSTQTAAPYNYAEWRPSLPASDSYEVSVWYPAAGNPANNTQYTVYYNGGSQTFTVNQTVGGGGWQVLGTFGFAAGTSGYVSLSDQARKNKTVLADAVRFRSLEPVQLTMAVSPPGTGATSPAAGTYTHNPGEVVNISATPAEGYVFSEWQVSAGDPVASPYSATTTVTMDVSKTVTAVFVPPAPQFRAFWADAFHIGFKSAAEIDSMVARAQAGRYNAIIAEVMAFQDNVGGGHGAYWNSSVIPKASDISGGIDPLAYLLQQAHAVGIEVHAWLVAYRVSSSWPPSGNATLQAHPEYLMVPQADIGTIATVGGYYVLDPGSPDVQEYLVSIVRELASNYALEGIHWDYIRYTQTDAGYPSETAYTKSGLARFKRITGYVGTPPPTGNTAWDDFRRREINELVRRVRAELPGISPNVKHTAALIPWGDAPSDFTSSSAYRTCYQDWRLWMELGYLDAGCPMLYYREYNSSQYLWYRNWVNACLGWRYNRHMYLGQANYLNTMPHSVTQLQYSYGQGADGTVNYSYYSTVDSNSDGATENDWNWYTYVGNNLFTTPATVPELPWRNPATATEGTVFGQVLDASTNDPVDDATVQVGSRPAVQTDGNGYFVLTMVPAAAAGTDYSITAGKSGWPSANATVTVLAGLTVRQDLILGDFTDCNNNGIPDRCDLSCAAPGCNVSGCGLGDDCDGNGVPDECDPDPDGDGLPAACDNCPDDNNPDQADTDVDGVGNACDLCPNTIPGLPVDATGCSAPVPGDFDRDGDVDFDDFNAFAACLTGSMVPSDPGCQAEDFDLDGDVDQTDFGTFQRCYSGATFPADPNCAG